MIITRKEAVEKNLKKYLTGKPCKRGHVAERRVSTNDCVECSKERQRSKKEKERKSKHYFDNREEYLKRASSRYQNKRLEIIEYAKQYAKDNSEKINKNRLARVKKDDKSMLAERIRCLIKEAIKSRGQRKNTKTSNILGCTVDEFKAHIEKQFTKGMGWENFDRWHIDHIVPISSAKSESEVISLNHFTNLRPMWAKDNLSKSNKMEFLL